jgi:hypothetical protein
MSEDSGRLRTLLADARGPIVVSRAISPGVAAVLTSLQRDDVVVRPTIRGSTVWGTVDDAIVVVEHPNWFGRPERKPPGRVVVLVHDGATPFSESEWHHCVVREDLVATAPGPSAELVMSDVERDRFHAEATAKARRLALLAGQVPGFRLAHGKPRSPVFVAMFPLDPHRVTSALAGSVDISAESVGVRFPDLPGGVRVRAGAAATEASLRTWVDKADKIVRSGERLES